MQPVDLAQQLIGFDSISSKSNARVAAQMRGWLERLGFEVEQLEFVDPQGELKVSLVAKRGPGTGGIAYFCHNDVVPVDDWNAAAGGPFSGAVSGGKLWGRGACDMKGSAAAALAAIARLPAAEQQSPIYFVATSDEEHGMHGARLVSQQSKLFAEMVAHGTVGIIGEPTQLQVVNSHKGTCNLTVTSRGRAAHSSTADGLNANWQLIDFLSYIKQVQLRCETEARLQNEQFQPPTLSLNLVITNRPAAANITVGAASCQVFLRPMPQVAWEELVEEIIQTTNRLGLELAPVSKLPPVFTPADRPFVQTALRLVNAAQVGTQLGTVSYATDGCWFTRMHDLIVLGPGSIEQAHRPDEWIAIDQLEQGVDVFQRFFMHYAFPANSPIHSQPLQGSAKDDLEHAAIPAQPTVIFRRATLDDLAAVNGLLGPFVTARKLLKRTQAEMELLVPSGFVASVGDRIVGFSAVEIYSRKLAEIQCLAVATGYQGHGIGSELVRRCVDLARERGVMEVLAISSSDTFLQKLGFNYSLPDQKRALFCQLRSRDQMFGSDGDDGSLP